MCSIKTEQKQYGGEITNIIENKLSLKVKCLQPWGPETEKYNVINKKKMKGQKLAFAEARRSRYVNHQINFLQTGVGQKAMMKLMHEH